MKLISAIIYEWRPVWVKYIIKRDFSIFLRISFACLKLVAYLLWIMRLEFELLVVIVKKLFVVCNRHQTILLIHAFNTDRRLVIDLTLVFKSVFSLIAYRAWSVILILIIDKLTYSKNNSTNLNAFPSS